MYPTDRALELEDRMHLGEGLVKTIFIHAFMDEHTFDVDRIKKCCTHYALPDGRLMPGCAYNMFYRHKDARFAGSAGKSDIWGKPAATTKAAGVKVAPTGSAGSGNAFPEQKQAPAALGKSLPVVENGKQGGCGC
jgi:hypothetical protein